MVVYKRKSCVSKDFGQILNLVGPIENRSNIGSGSHDVVNRSITHEKGYGKSQNRCDYLEDLGIFNVAKTEVYRKEAEYKDSYKVWIKSNGIFKACFVAPKSVGDADYEALSTTYVFKANCPIHVNYKNKDDEILKPVDSYSICNHANLNLLTNVERTRFVINVFEILFSLDDG